MSENHPHVLILPYPAQGHMLPLLDFTHQLVNNGVAITILVTPKNLPILDHLLSRNPSIKTLVLPFPSHPSIPAGVENVKDLPASGFRSMMYNLGKLRDPILEWFRNHPSPPSTIISDMLLGFTHEIATQLGIRRVWSVGPVLPPGEDDVSGQSNRGGSSSVLTSEILAWLDKCEDHSVVYVCFGSQAVLTNKQMEELAIALDKSGVKFILSAKRALKGHASNDYGVIPSWFEEKVAGRGLVVRDWSPQVLILKHQAIGAFLTHCGWNSTLESLIAGVPMLTWPMGADQFANANLLVDEHEVAIRACEGAQTVPNSDELAKLLAEAVQGNNVEERRLRASELRKVAINGIKEGGNSFKDLAAFVKHLREEATKIEV
ncbi:hypothetical protein AABB24_006345 [Solanum stoloniferum]|uniref:Glycosyltransferase n=1 Tax=Solanum stoloniferum TaxID=62892 RepID=A0ABD2V3T8_9SOLN